MDKVIFLFHRKDGLTRQEFFDHYLQVHADLGMRLTKTMDGYTVNLTDVGEPLAGAPDAVTEIWSRSAADFMEVDKSFETPEDAAELMADHDSFIGPYHAYQVEEKLVSGGSPDSALGSRTEGVKRVSLHTGDSAPPASAEVSRVIEHRVLRALTPGAPPVDLIVSEWASTADGFGAVSGPAFVVSEYRKKEPVE